MRLALSLELRPLPSTGITRLHQYYGPLRHLKAPDLSLAGVQLAIPGHAMRLPVLRALSLCTCCRHYPGAADGRRLRSLSQPYQPSPVRRPGRPARCPFRGLLGVHSRCGLHTRAATNSWHAIRRLQPFRYLVWGFFCQGLNLAPLFLFIFSAQVPSVDPPRGRHGHPA